MLKVICHSSERGGMDSDSCPDNLQNAYGALLFPIDSDLHFQRLFSNEYSVVVHHGNLNLTSMN